MAVEYISICLTAWLCASAKNGLPGAGVWYGGERESKGALAKEPVALNKRQWSPNHFVKGLVPELGQTFRRALKRPHAHIHKRSWEKRKLSISPYFQLLKAVFAVAVPPTNLDGYSKSSLYKLQTRTGNFLPSLCWFLSGWLKFTQGNLIFQVQIHSRLIFPIVWPCPQWTFQTKYSKGFISWEMKCIVTTWLICGPSVLLKYKSYSTPLMAMLVAA